MPKSPPVGRTLSPRRDCYLWRRITLSAILSGEAITFSPRYVRGRAAGNWCRLGAAILICPDGDANIRGADRMTVRTDESKKTDIRRSDRSTSLSVKGVDKRTKKNRFNFSVKKKRFGSPVRIGRGELMWWSMKALQDTCLL